jgi:hypothetical protein
MTPLEILKAGRAVIADPTRWTQGVWVRDAQGVSLDDDVMSEAAACFCSDGALYRAVGYAASNAAPAEYGSAYHELNVTVNELEGISDIIGYNDSHTHAEVLAVWDATIARLEK